MFDFDELWRDYAVYTPALQTYYTSFARLAQVASPLPSGLLPKDLDFLRPATPLFKLRDALMSAGVVMDGQVHRLRGPLDDMVGHRDRAATYLTADSGGFQVLTKGLRIDNDLRLAQLRWSERYFDAALPWTYPALPSARRGMSISRTSPSLSGILWRASNTGSGTATRPCRWSGCSSFTATRRSRRRSGTKR